MAFEIANINGFPLTIGIILLALGIYAGYLTFVKKKSTIMKQNALGITAILIIGAVVFGGFSQVGDLLSGQQAFSISPGGDIIADGPEAGDAEICGTNRNPTVTFNAYNKLATTTENFDTRTLWVQTSASATGDTLAGTGTQVIDSTSASVTVSCNKWYYVFPVAGPANTAGLDANVSTYVDARGQDVEVEVIDGYVKFRAIGPTPTLEVDTYKHAILEVRAFDPSANAFVRQVDALTNGTGYIQDDEFSTFGSDAVLTNFTVGAGGNFNMRFDLRANGTNNLTYIDRGTIYGIDYSTNWLDPTIDFNGNTLNDATASLTSEEKTGLNVYDKIYFLDTTKVTSANIESLVFDGSSPETLNVDIDARGGVNPSVTDQLNHKIVERGIYQSAQNNLLLKIGAYKDDSTTSLVYADLDFHNGIA